MRLKIIIQGQRLQHRDWMRLYRNDILIFFYFLSIQYYRYSITISNIKLWLWLHINLLLIESIICIYYLLHTILLWYKSPTRQNNDEISLILSQILHLNLSIKLNNSAFNSRYNLHNLSTLTSNLSNISIGFDPDPTLYKI